MGEKGKLFVGFEAGTGKQVWIPFFHILISGQTQRSGKTTLLRTLARQAVEKGYRVLIFDTKSNLQEFSDFGQEVPICLRETTDALTLLGLLESIMGRRLPAQYLAALSRVSERATSFKNVLENAIVMEQKTNSPFVKDVMRNIIELLNRLIQQTADKVTSPKLELPYEINRITMNKFALEGQQMIIKTAFEDALLFEKVIVILDESSKFLPQRYRSACERAINHFVTQGAISLAFLFMSTQFLATTSKDQMKAMDVKLLGRQSHDTECEHTLDLIPKTETKMTNDTVMGLRLGHFIVVADEKVTITYVCPENGDQKECQEVALGKRQPQDIHYRFSQLLTEEEAKALSKKHSTDKVIQIEAPDPQPEPEAVPIKPLPKIELPQKKIDEPQIIKEKPKKTPMATVMFKDDHRIEDMLQRLLEIEQKLNPEQQPKIDVTLETVQTQVKVTKVTKQLKATDENDRGKILMLAKEGFFKDKWHPLRNIVNAFEARPWTANDLAIKKELYAMANEGLLAVKKSNSREFLYSLNANIEFVEI